MSTLRARNQIQDKGEEMKILKLTAENIKRLIAVEITPDGNLVQITGKNGAGKTSVLDAIWWALAGTKHIQAQPIRKGENKARVRLDLGEIVVERKFTEAGSTLTVESIKGARLSSPQTLLDKLLGELSFDPLAFSRMETREQFDELRRISKLDVDIDELDALNKGDYAKRTDLNRDSKAKRAQIDGMIIPANTPDELVDESVLVDELQKAGEYNAQIEQRKANRERIILEAKGQREQAEKLMVEAKALIKAADEYDEKLKSAPELPPPVDTVLLRQNIEKAAIINRSVAALKQKRMLISQVEELENKSTSITEQMCAREQAKADAITRASMPIPDIGFGDGQVIYKNIPFDQASDAEKLRVSLAIAIAANPELRVIRIRDVSLLDDDGLAAIAKMADELDYQVWIERVDGSGKVGVVIEDGMVKS